MGGNLWRSRGIPRSVGVLKASQHRLCTIMRVLSLILWSGIAASPSCLAERPNAPTPLWSANVIQNLTGARHPDAPKLVDRNRAGVTFLDNETLLVHEVDLDTTQLSSRQNPDVSSPFRLHISVLNARSGKLLLANDWGTSVHNSSVDVVKGGILVRTGPTLRLLTHSLIEVQKVTFHNDPEEGATRWDILLISVSPTGNTVLINRISQRARVSHFDVLDGTTLRSRYSWDESPALYNSYSVSDTAIVADDFHRKNVIRTEFGTKQWKPLGVEFKNKCLGLATFLSDHQLEHACEQGAHADEKGLSELQRITVSQDGKVIAESLGDLEIKKHILSEASVRLIAMRTVVYDLSQKKRVLVLPVDPLPKNDYDVSLSSDGSRLAVLNDRDVSVYSIPVQ
jgi:hypothetical protein